MPVHMSRFESATDTLKIPIEGEELTIRYNRNVLTKKRMRDLRDFFRDEERQNDDRTEQATFELLCEVIKDWDLLGSDGSPMPVTQETFDAMPFTLARMIAEKLSETIFPNPTSADA